MSLSTYECLKAKSVRMFKATVRFQSRYRFADKTTNAVRGVRKN